jgi:hypothetical protein
MKHFNSQLKLRFGIDIATLSVASKICLGSAVHFKVMSMEVFEKKEVNMCSFTTQISPKLGEKDSNLLLHSHLKLEFRSWRI